MRIKNPDCINKQGKPLTCYLNERSALEAASYLNTTTGGDFLPYDCKKCDFWHISPQNRHTPSRKCGSCISSSGEYKDLYSKEEFAKQRARIIHKEQGVRLSLYSCPSGEGWHLTKNAN